jgi:hypothetical protein
MTFITRGILGGLGKKGAGRAWPNDGEDGPSTREKVKINDYPKGIKRKKSNKENQPTKRGDCSTQIMHEGLKKEKKGW